MTTPDLAALRECPFCGAGDTIISEQRLRPRMDGKEPALVSVTLRHWCAPLPGVVSRLTEYRGRDHDSAIAAWNRRAPDAALLARVERMKGAFRAFISWADQKCPCHNEEPNPCPLCGASVENLEPCKAADNTLPRRLLQDARAALSSAP